MDLHRFLCKLADRMFAFFSVHSVAIPAWIPSSINISECLPKAPMQAQAMTPCYTTFDRWALMLWIMSRSFVPSHFGIFHHLARSSSSIQNFCIFLCKFLSDSSSWWKVCILCFGLWISTVQVSFSCGLKPSALPVEGCWCCHWLLIWFVSSQLSIFMSSGAAVFLGAAVCQVQLYCFMGFGQCLWNSFGLFDFTSFFLIQNGSLFFHVQLSDLRIDLNLLNSKYCPHRWRVLWPQETVRSYWASSLSDQ